MTSTKKKKVFIWDLDETLILFQSLLDHSHAEKYRKDKRIAEAIGIKIEHFIFTISDEYFFFKQLEDCDQVSILDVKAGKFYAPEGKKVKNKSSLKKRYKCIEKIYKGCTNNMRYLLTSRDYKSLTRLRRDLDIITDGWTSLAMKCLAVTHGRSDCVNVLVTNTQLVPALAKIMLYDLGGIFNVQNVYSATSIGKENCFERIMQRFGRNVTYVAVGDGRDEEQAAKVCGMSFWRVECHKDLIQIYGKIKNEEWTDHKKEEE